MTIDVSIAIVSYNVGVYLRACLDSIYKSKTNFSYEIIVVDNGSSDKVTRELFKLYPSIIWIQNETNKGFAAANNQAIQVAQGNLFWMLNPDTIVYDDSMDSLVSALLTYENVAACGSRLLYQDGSLQTSCYPFPTLWREFVRLFHLETLFPKTGYKMHKWPTNRIQFVDNVQGASLLIRKSALKEIGLLDENYFMYTEEVDLNYRFQKAGWKNAWIPTSVVMHYGGQSTQQALTPMFLQLYQTKIYFFRKHYGGLTVFLYKVVLFFAAIGRIITGFFMNIFKQSPDSSNLIKNYSQLLANIAAY